MKKSLWGADVPNSYRNSLRIIFPCDCGPVKPCWFGFSLGVFSHLAFWGEHEDRLVSLTFRSKNVWTTLLQADTLFIHLQLVQGNTYTKFITLGSPLESQGLSSGEQEEWKPINQRAKLMHRVSTWQAKTVCVLSAPVVGKQLHCGYECLSTFVFERSQRTLWS